MSLGGSSPSGSTTTTQMPASYMLPYISTALGQANKLLSYQPQYYSGPLVAGFSQPQQQAMGAVSKLGMNGTPALDAAQGFDTTLLEDAGGSNPYLDATFKQAAGATQGRLASEFGGTGRNVDASQALRGQQLDNLATGIYGKAYQQDMQDALAAGNQAQNLYDTRMNGLTAAEGVGKQVQDLAQQNIDANQQKYNYYQMLPIQQLQQYESFLGGVQPGMQTTNPYFSNPLGNAMNAASMGMNLYNQYNQMPLYSSNSLPPLDTLQPAGNWSATTMPIDEPDYYSI